MTTRYAAAGGPLKQNRWMSDPEYADIRGVNGTAAAAKASLLLDERKRRLIYFLQSLSLGEQGLKGIASELLRMFPERMGTPTMHRVGASAQQIYSDEETERIHRELRGHSGLRTRDAAKLLEVCRDKAGEQLHKYLLELCINPRLEIQLPGEDDMLAEADRRAILEANPELDTYEFQRVGVPYFRDLSSALFEYQERYGANAMADFSATSISKEVFAALDYCRRTGKMILIEGNSGIGKSESASAWCNMHRDSVRLVKLKGINHRSNFFRTVAKALGLPSTFALSPSKLQARVEDFLEKTKLMLLIDEAQYLLPGNRRIYTEPELINWINTACYNQGVPVALFATAEFGRRKAQVEQQTVWSSEQLIRRIRRHVLLPERPTNEDLEIVARKFLPDAEKRTIQFVMGYALTSKRYFQAIADVVDDAKLIATDAGRTNITAADIQKAVMVFRAPSDAAIQRTGKAASPRGRRATEASVAEVPQDGRSGSADKLRDGGGDTNLLTGNPVRDISPTDYRSRSGEVEVEA